MVNLKGLGELIEKIEGKFLNVPVEVSFISKELSSRRVVSITRVESKGGIILFITDKTNYISLELEAVETTHYYGPGSLVFITKNGATLTLRPVDSILK